MQLLGTLVLVPLPGVGIAGYVAGSLLSALLEAGLCLWLAARYTRLKPPLFSWLIAPGLSALLAALTTNLLLRELKAAGIPLLPAAVSSLLFAAILYLAALHAQGIRLRTVLRVRW